MTFQKSGMLICVCCGICTYLLIHLVSHKVVVATMITVSVLDSVNDDISGTLSSILEALSQLHFQTTICVRYFSYPCFYRLGNIGMEGQSNLSKVVGGNLRNQKERPYLVP